MCTYWNKVSLTKSKSKKNKKIDSIGIGLASPEETRRWGERRLPNGTLIGRIDKDHTVDYESLKPIEGGLFCERIFGPVTDFYCSCERRGEKNEKFCPNCEVEFTKSRVRRTRMGYIPLAVPVAHVWYLRGRPSYIANLLGKSRSSVDRLAYGETLCESFIGNTYSNLLATFQQNAKTLVESTQNENASIFRGKPLLDLSQHYSASPKPAPLTPYPFTPYPEGVKGYGVKGYGFAGGIAKLSTERSKVYQTLFANALALAPPMLKPCFFPGFALPLVQPAKDYRREPQPMFQSGLACSSFAPWRSKGSSLLPSETKAYLLPRRGIGVSAARHTKQSLVTRWLWLRQCQSLALQTKGKKRLVDNTSLFSFPLQIFPSLTNREGREMGQNKNKYKLRLSHCFLSNSQPDRQVFCLQPLYWQSKARACSTYPKGVSEASPCFASPDKAKELGELLGLHYSLRLPQRGMYSNGIACFFPSDYPFGTSQTKFGKHNTDKLEKSNVNAKKQQSKARFCIPSSLLSGTLVRRKVLCLTCFANRREQRLALETFSSRERESGATRSTKGHHLIAKGQNWGEKVLSVKRIVLKNKSFSSFFRWKREASQVFCKFAVSSFILSKERVKGREWDFSFKLARKQVYTPMAFSFPWLCCRSKPKGAKGIPLWGSPLLYPKGVSAARLWHWRSQSHSQERSRQPMLSVSSLGEATTREQSQEKNNTSITKNKKWNFTNQIGDTREKYNKSHNLPLFSTFVYKEWSHRFSFLEFFVWSAQNDDLVLPFYAHQPQANTPKAIKAPTSVLSTWPSVEASFASGPFSGCALLPSQTFALAKLQPGSKGLLPKPLLRQGAKPISVACFFPGCGFGSANAKALLRLPLWGIAKDYPLHALTPKGYVQRRGIGVCQTKFGMQGHWQQSRMAYPFGVDKPFGNAMQASLSSSQFFRLTAREKRGQQKGLHSGHQEQCLATRNNFLSFVKNASLTSKKMHLLDNGFLPPYFAPFGSQSLQPLQTFDMPNSLKISPEKATAHSFQLRNKKSFLICDKPVKGNKPSTTNYLPCKPHTKKDKQSAANPLLCLSAAPGTVFPSGQQAGGNTVGVSHEAKGAKGKQALSIASLVKRNALLPSETKFASFLRTTPLGYPKDRSHNQQRTTRRLISLASPLEMQAWFAKPSKPLMVVPLACQANNYPPVAVPKVMQTCFAREQSQKNNKTCGISTVSETMQKNRQNRTLWEGSQQADVYETASVDPQQFPRLSTLLCFTGGTALKYLLSRFDLVLLGKFLRYELKNLEFKVNTLLALKMLTYSQGLLLGKLAKRRSKQIRRLKLLELFQFQKSNPEWMILSVLPVLPPDLRPILRVNDDFVVASDLNRLYQTVLRRNNTIRERLDDPLPCPESGLFRQRSLQKAVDGLLENGKGGGTPLCASKRRPLVSLSHVLKGKKGLFRQHLLGKRVDYSGRSVIVVGPRLNLHECGLPKEMAMELFQPFLLHRLKVKGLAVSNTAARRMVQQEDPLIWHILKQLVYEHPVLLNRAPTLHRLGIQAFQPRLVSGRAILLHPLVCNGFNADFDGDQMAVHIPLSFQARAEAWKIMWSKNNLLSPATGQPILVPSQDMVLGCYYLSVAVPRVLGYLTPSGTSCEQINPFISKHPASSLLPFPLPASLTPIPLTPKGYRGKGYTFVSLGSKGSILRSKQSKGRLPGVPLLFSRRLSQNQGSFVPLLALHFLRDSKPKVMQSPGEQALALLRQQSLLAVPKVMQSYRRIISSNYRVTDMDNSESWQNKLLSQSLFKEQSKTILSRMKNYISSVPVEKSGQFSKNGKIFRGNQISPQHKSREYYFSNLQDSLVAYSQGRLQTHTPFWVRVDSAQDFPANKQNSPPFKYLRPLLSDAEGNGFFLSTSRHGTASPREEAYVLKAPSETAKPQQWQSFGSDGSVASLGNKVKQTFAGFSNEVKLPKPGNAKSGLVEQGKAVEENTKLQNGDRVEANEAALLSQPFANETKRFVAYPVLLSETLAVPSETREMQNQGLQSRRQQSKGSIAGWSFLEPRYGSSQKICEIILQDSCSNTIVESNDMLEPPLELRLSVDGNLVKISPTFQNHYSCNATMIDQCKETEGGSIKYIRTTPGRVVINRAIFSS